MVAIQSPGQDAADAPPAPRRRVWQSLRRGFRRRCPHCGEGRVFRAFLKVAPACPVCGEDLSHHRADDAPPYITIVIVGHVIVTAILFIQSRWQLSNAVLLAVTLPLTAILSLVLLPSVKGAVVGLQWALRMHGFDEKARDGIDFDDPDFGAVAATEGRRSPER